MILHLECQLSTTDKEARYLTIYDYCEIVFVSYCDNKYENHF